MQPIPQSTVETALTTCEKWPMTVGFFLAIALMGALAYWLLFKFWPAWLPSRRSIASTWQRRWPAGRGGAGRHRRCSSASRVASGVSGQGSGRTHRQDHERVSDVHEVVKQIAQKVGISVLLLGLFSGAFVAGFGIARHAVHLVQDADRVKCNPPLPDRAGVPNGTYREVKTVPASAQPQSAFSERLLSTTRSLSARTAGGLQWVKLVASAFCFAAAWPRATAAGTAPPAQ